MFDKSKARAIHPKFVTNNTINIKFFDDEEEEVYMSPKDIEKIKEMIWSNNAYEFIETETRHALFVGRSRSGKSTCKSVCKDPCYAPQIDSIFSEKGEPKFQSFSIKSKNGEIRKYTINIVDSPGVFECLSTDDKDKERTNEAILTTIAKCLEHEITSINAIVIFVAFETGINPNDIAAMQLFLNMFGGSGVKIALCITRADNHNKEWRAMRIAELKKHEVIAQLIDEEKMEIFFMGCVDPRCGNYATEKDLLRGYKNVYNMRAKLLQFIFDANESVQLNKMKIAQNKINQIKETIEILTKNFNTLTECTDFELQSIQQLIISHKDNMTYLSNNRAYMNLSDLAHVYISFFQAATKFDNDSTCDAEIKASLLWPLNLGNNNEN